MEAQLVIVGGKVNKSIIALKLPTIIGRGRQAKLKISHPMVSRQHCELFEKDGLIMIKDLGSLNGTFLGEKRVKEAPLPPETEFVVEPLTFRIQYKYDGDLSALPPTIFADDESEDAAPAEAAGNAAPDAAPNAADPLAAGLDVAAAANAADPAAGDAMPDFQALDPQQLNALPTRPVTGGSDDFAIFGAALESGLLSGDGAPGYALTSDKDLGKDKNAKPADSE
jgi:hypothetical protein